MTPFFFLKNRYDHGRTDCTIAASDEDICEKVSLVFLITLLEPFIRGQANNGQLVCYVVTQKKLGKNNALISKL